MENNSKAPFFEGLANRVTQLTGTSMAFIIAVFIIVAWAVSGPFFNFSETWQLIINTSTTIVTFLMVFLIQKSQNKDSKAIQLKLNELIASVKGASNRMVNIEDLNEDELDKLHEMYMKMAKVTISRAGMIASSGIEKQITSIDDKMDSIESRVDEVNEKMDDKLSEK